MTAEECRVALDAVDHFYEPPTREEMTLWDHLLSEAEAENHEGVGRRGSDLDDAHKGP